MFFMFSLLHDGVHGLQRHVGRHAAVVPPRGALHQHGVGDAVAAARRARHLQRVAGLQLHALALTSGRDHPLVAACEVRSSVVGSLLAPEADTTVALIARAHLERTATSLSGHQSDSVYRLWNAKHRSALLSRSAS